MHRVQHYNLETKLIKLIFTYMRLIFLTLTNNTTTLLLITLKAGYFVCQPRHLQSSNLSLINQEGQSQLSRTSGVAILFFQIVSGSETPWQ